MRPLHRDPQFFIGAIRGYQAELEHLKKAQERFSGRPEQFRMLVDALDAYGRVFKAAKAALEFLDDCHSSPILSVALAKDTLRTALAKFEDEDEKPRICPTCGDELPAGAELVKLKLESGCTVQACDSCAGNLPVALADYSPVLRRAIEVEREKRERARKDEK